MAVISGRIVDCFSPLVVSEAPLDTLRASPQGGGFQASVSFISPNPVSKVHGSSEIGSYLSSQGKGSSGLYNGRAHLISPD